MIELTIQHPEDEGRLLDLLDRIPRGSFYASLGDIIPYRSNTNFRLETNSNNTQFAILLNGTLSKFVTTDGSGNVDFSINLPLGDVTIDIEKEFSTEKLTKYVTTRHYANWLAAIGEELDFLDDSIEKTLRSYYLAEADTDDLESVHGRNLLTPKTGIIDVESYREQLQLIRQAFRHYAGILFGKYAVIAAIAQVNPIIFEKIKGKGLLWILGDKINTNGELADYTKIPIYSTTNLQPFVNLVSVSDEVNSGNATLNYSINFRRFKFDPPFYSFPLLYAMSDEVTGIGDLTISASRSRAELESLYFPRTTNIDYNRLFINIDGRGPVEVWLNLGGSQTIDVKINAFFKANERYNKAYQLIQLSGALAGHVELLTISDGITLGTIIIDVTANGVGFDTFRFRTSTTGYGSTVNINKGETGIITDNAGNELLILNGHNTPVSTDATGNVASKYSNVASLINGNDKLLLESYNDYSFEGESSIIIEDGPANFATFPAGAQRGLYDLPQIFTTITTSAASGTLVKVPSGDTSKFSESINIETPFDVIVGYGYRNTAISVVFKLVPDISTTHLAEMEITSGGTFDPGDTHVVLTINNNLSGAHKIIQINPSDNKKAIISYKGIGAGQPSSIAGLGSISIIGIDPSTVSGAGTLTYKAFTPVTSIAWTAPGDSIGAYQDISTFGYFRIYSNNGRYLDILVDTLPLGDATDNAIPVGKFSTYDSSISGGFAKLWSSGEKVSVTNVNQSTDDEWTVFPALNGTYNTGMVVYSAYDKFPLRVDSIDPFGSIDLNIISMPTSTLSDTITIVGSNLPNGWVDTSSGSAVFANFTDLRFKSALLAYLITGEITIERSIPFTSSMLGYQYTLKVWVRNADLVDNTSMGFTLAFDFGSGFIESGTTTISDPDNTLRSPQLIEYTQTLPVTATSFRVRIKKVSGTGARFIIDRILLTNPIFGETFLGFGTIPRNDSITSAGELMYVFSQVDLNSDEHAVIGINPSTLKGGDTGLIRESHNAHEIIEAFDITDTTDNNVRGFSNVAPSTAFTLTNMSGVIRSPLRYCYIKPTIVSLVENVILTFTPSAPYKATLSIDSNQDQLSSILFENSVPVPHNQWQYNTSTEIEVTTGFNTSAIYTIEYQALIQAETLPTLIDISGSIHDTWFADFVVFNRHVSNTNIRRGVISVEFLTNLTALLSRPSDRNKLTSSLIENTGSVQRIIPQELWDYIDSNNIIINSSEFNPNSVYTFEYNQRLLNLQRAANIITEIRSATTSGGLSSAIYRPISTNDPIDSSLAFHQFRITINNVGDLRDVRIHGVNVKGLNLSGSGSPPPGLL